MSKLPQPVPAPINRGPTDRSLDWLTGYLAQIEDGRADFAAQIAQGLAPPKAVRRRAPSVRRRRQGGPPDADAQTRAARKALELAQAKASAADSFHRAALDIVVMTCPEP